MRSKKTVSIRLLLVLLALVLVIGSSVGGTLAWLMAKTEPVVNTFTTSDVDIILTETTSEYEMVPGAEIVKDPKVTVLSNSEACWLFVRIVESESSANNITTGTADATTYITYALADGWIALAGESGVYYREHEATGSTDGTPISVLRDDKVFVPVTVTKEMMNAENLELKLSFTAYAVQKAGMATAAEAWAQARTLG